MFTINTPGPNRLEITMSGRLDSDSMRQALHELVEKSSYIREGP